MRGDTLESDKQSSPSHVLPLSVDVARDTLSDPFLCSLVQCIGKSLALVYAMVIFPESSTCIQPVNTPPSSYGWAGERTGWHQRHHVANYLLMGVFPAQ